MKSHLSISTLTLACGLTSLVYAERIVVGSWDMKGVSGYHEEFNDVSASIGRGTLDQVESGSNIFRSNGGTALNSRLADGGQRIRFWNAAHGNGAHLDFTLDLTGLSDLALSYAYAGETGTYINNTLSYSTDGGVTFSPTGVAVPSFVTGSSHTWQLASLDLSSVTALNGSSTVVLRLTVDGATNNNNSIFIDNLEFTAEADAAVIPANSGTLAVLSSYGVSALQSVILEETNNYTSFFEPPEGYSVGEWVSDPEWLLGGATNPYIASNGLGGSLSVELAGTDALGLSLLTESTSSVFWLDYYIRPVFMGLGDLPSVFSPLQEALTGFVQVGPDGEVYVLHGDGAGGGIWLSSGYTVPLTGNVAQDWFRITYRLDYGTGSWDLYLDDSLQLIDLGFIRPAGPRLSRFDLIGSIGGLTSFDNFGAGFVNPLFDDEDNDGIDSAYELAEGLDPTINDRHLDLDSDTLSNVEEYRLGLRAGDPDSDTDSLPDGYEVSVGLNPLDGTDARTNIDRDYLTNAEEYALGFDPLVYDTHESGVGDGYGIDGRGNVKMEVFNGTGSRLSDLFANPNYPGAADQEIWLEDLDLELNHAYALGLGDFFGDRVRGYIVPPVSGAYTFYLSANDETEFWLSSSKSAHEASRMTHVPTRTAWGAWSKFPTQTSESVQLEAGEEYYFEILHKQETAGSFFRIAWEIPEEGAYMIASEFLRPWQPEAGDLDQDGLPDSWETANGLDPQSAAWPLDGAHGDLDSDGLRNVEELVGSTLPNAPDTDGDGYWDWEEIRLFGTAANDVNSVPSAVPSSDWAPAVIGAALPSRIYEDGDEIIVIGSGAPYETALIDTVSYASQPIGANAGIVVRVDQENVPADLSAFGIVIRSGFDSDDASYILTVPRSMKNVRTLARSQKGAEAEASTVKFNAALSTLYLRVLIKGDVILPAYSADGLVWSALPGYAIGAGADKHIGLIATTRDPLANTYTSMRFTVVDWDEDGDGLLSGDELAYGTSETSADTDGDGYSDFEEIFEYYSDPTVADLSPAVVAASADGASAVSTLGDWEVDGAFTYVSSGRGAAEYDLTITEDAIYRLSLLAQTRSNQTNIIDYSVKVEINGEYIGRIRLSGIEDAAGYGRILTPWLPAGTHRIRFFVDNTYTYRSLQLNGLSLDYIGGDDVDADGTPDWMQNRLTANNGLMVTASESPVSPLSLEGKARYLGLVNLAGGAEVHGLPEYGWYTDVALDPNQPTSVNLSYENGAVQESATFTWVATDVIAAEDITIRKGDALRLTALDDTDPADQPIEITIDSGSPVASTESAPLIQSFDLAGVYTVSATVGSLSGSFTVTVLEADLGEELNLLVDDEARSFIPAALSSAAEVQIDASVSVLETTVSGSPRSFDLAAIQPEPAYMAARLPGSGAVLDQVDLKPIYLASNSQTRVEVTEYYDDGAALVEVDFVLDYIPEDLRVEARIVVGGIIFDDGTLVKTLTAADFDELGRTTLKFIMPFEAITSICHRIYVYDGDDFLGQR